LHGGPYISDIVTARAGERMLGGLGDEALLQMIWYRQAAGGDFEELKEVTGGFYQPSADDIGARLLCRATARNDAGLSAFGEWGPVTAPPVLQEAQQDAVEEGTLVITVEREGTYNAPRRLVLTPSQLQLHDTASTRHMLEEEQGGALGGKGGAGTTPGADSPLDKTLCVPLGPDVSVKLATAAIMSATVTLPAAACTAGGTPVAADGQVFLQLKFRDPQDRDLLALVMREWCAAAGGQPASPSSQDSAAEVAAGAAADEDTPEASPDSSSDTTHAAQQLTEDRDADSDGEEASPSDGAEPEAAPGTVSSHSGTDDSSAEADAVEVAAAAQAASVHSAAQAAALRDATQENEQLSARVASLKRQVEHMQGSAKTSKAAHSSTKRELKSTVAQVASLQASLSEARNAADTLRRDNGKIKADLEAASSTASSSGADLAAKAKLIGSLRASLKEAEADTKHAQSKAAQLQAQLDTSQAAVKQLEAKLAAAQGELREEQAKNAQLQTAVSDVKTQLRTAEQARDAATGAAAAANTKLKTHEGEAASLRGALVEARQASTSAAEAGQKAAARAEGLQKDLAAEGVKRIAAEEQLQALQTQLGEVQAQAELATTAQEKAAAAEAELSHTRDTVDDITAERNALKRKLASLKRDMQKMRAPPAAPAADPAQLQRLHSQVEDLQAQNKLLRAEAAAAPAASPPTPSRDAYGGVGGGSGGMSTTPASSRSFVPAGGLSGSSHAGPEVVASLQRLVADLTSELQDKNEALQMQKATKEALAARITALETAAAGGGSQ